MTKVHAEVVHIEQDPHYEEDEFEAYHDHNDEKDAVKGHGDVEMAYDDDFEQASDNDNEASEAVTHLKTQKSSTARERHSKHEHPSESSGELSGKRARARVATAEEIYARIQKEIALKIASKEKEEEELAARRKQKKKKRQAEEKRKKRQADEALETVAVASKSTLPAIKS